MISIIVLNYRNPPLLRLCLTSIRRALSRDTEHEIIVIDSHSSVETRSIVEEEFSESNITLVPFAENTGYTRGVNEGIKRGKGEFLLILNPDIVPLPGSIETLATYLKEHPRIGLIGPQLLNFDGTPQSSCFRFYMPTTMLYRRIQHLPFAKRALNWFTMSDKDLSRPVLADWLMGSALMVQREALKSVGFMDEHFFHYMTDVDWARRFWENEYRVVYLPSARMYHYHRRGSKGHFGIFDAILERETRWHIVDAMRYFIKYGLRNAFLETFGIRKFRSPADVQKTI